MLDRLPTGLRRLLYAGGSRADRLNNPDAVVRALEVAPGSIVADLGPGYGHFTLRLTRAVEPDGVVYALDASRSTLDELAEAAERRGITNLRFVHVARDRLEVPEPVDLLFVSATYHHIADRARYFTDARAALRLGGRVAILESRREGLLAPWMGRHATDPRVVTDEMARAGFRLARALDHVVRGHRLAVFEPADAA